MSAENSKVMRIADRYSYHEGIGMCLDTEGEYLPVTQVLLAIQIVENTEYCRMCFKAMEKNNRDCPNCGEKLAPTSRTDLKWLREMLSL